MKRNKTNHRVGRSGVSPYKKYGKRPCAECQRQTERSRKAAFGKADDVQAG